MTDNLLKKRELEVFIRSLRLIPSRGGAYEVTVNGDLLYSKKQLKRHAEPGEVEYLIEKKLDELSPQGYPLPPQQDDD